MIDLTKVKEFVTAFESKSEAFLTSLDQLLTKSESAGPVHDFLAAHFPQALTWESELHAAVLFTKSAELKILPEVDAVLAFLASLNLQPAKVAA